MLCRPHFQSESMPTFPAVRGGDTRVASASVGLDQDNQDKRWTMSA